MLLQKTKKPTMPADMYCKKPGHNIADCFRRKRRNEHVQADAAPHTSHSNQLKEEHVLFNSFSPNSSLKTLSITICDYETNCVVDTGSTCSLTNETLVDKLKLAKIPRITPLQWFDGTVHKFFFITKALAVLPDVKVELDFVIVPRSHSSYDIDNLI
jgi:hypothetical protein